MSETNSELPKDAKGWANFVSNIDVKNHKKAMVALGVVAAFGVGVYNKTKKGSAKSGEPGFFVAYGDRRMEAKGVVSVGELAERGTAVGLPTSEESVEMVGTGREVFAMGEEYAFPLENEADAGKYSRALDRIKQLFANHLGSQSEPE